MRVRFKTIFVSVQLVIHLISVLRHLVLQHIVTASLLNSFKLFLGMNSRLFKINIFVTKNCYQICSKLGNFTALGLFVLANPKYSDQRSKEIKLTDNNVRLTIRDKVWIAL